MLQQELKVLDINQGASEVIEPVEEEAKPAEEAAPESPPVEEKPAEEAIPAEEEKPAEEPVAKTLTQKLLETQSQIDVLGASMTAKDAQIDELKAEVARMVEHAEEREAIILKQEEEVVEATKAVEAMKASLANPAAFADAVNGEAEPVADGGSGDDESTGGLNAQYAAITDPKARTKFWKEHGAEIQEERKQKSK